MSMDAVQTELENALNEQVVAQLAAAADKVSDPDLSDLDPYGKMLHAAREAQPIDKINK